MGPYRGPPFPATVRPTLPGLWSPSRSFDHRIAPAVDASRTRCASIPDCRAPCSQAAALVRLVTEITSERASLRSAPASSSLAVQPFGWGSSRRPWGRGVRRDDRFEAFVVTAKKQVPSSIAAGRMGIAGCFRTVDTRVLGPERLSTFVLGSREDPPDMPCGASARLLQGPASLRMLDTPCSLVPPSSWVG